MPQLSSTLIFILYCSHILGTDAFALPGRIPSSSLSKFTFSTTLTSSIALSMKSDTNKEIYNVPGSGWKSSSWNWGYAVGTGHDCALICRKRWGTKNARIALIKSLSDPSPIDQQEEGNSSFDINHADNSRDPPFEEVKLILALAWQNGRWDGSDGGLGGYGEILRYMADAQRYENDDECQNSKLMVKDMVERFHLISSDKDIIERMKNLENSCQDDVDKMRRYCAATVLSAMGFIEKGL